ncbi:MAG TPA: glycosyltransferase [Thermoanaerobaculia bacterium]
MATIAFVLDHEEGHLIPTFKLARQLVARGHSVRYLGLVDSGDFVRRQGFEFVPILENVLPAGTVRKLWDTVEVWRDQGHEAVYDRFLGAISRGEGLDRQVLHTQPKLFILNSLMGLNALVMDYRYGLPVILLTPLLRIVSRAHYAAAHEEVLLRLAGGATAFFSLVQKCDPGARRFRDITARLTGMRELIQCPSELELPENLHVDPEVFYIEAGIDLERRDDRGFPWERLDAGRRILYCSLGSQTYLGGKEKAVAFLRAVAAGAARRPDWQLVLATGGLVEPAELPLPADSIALPWVPQVQMLERAAVMITHGGLGTVKECIIHGVPMVVCAVTRDQPENAKRVVHHRLGVAGDFDTPPPDGYFALVDQVAGDPSFKENVERMRRRFVEIEESGIGVRLIEEVLARPKRSQQLATSHF